jgi:CubicO group peptidase (beta-lactamase class C family)
MGTSRSVWLAIAAGLGVACSGTYNVSSAPAPGGAPAESPTTPETAVAETDGGRAPPPSSPAILSSIDPATIPGWTASNWSCPASTGASSCLKEWLEHPTNPDGTTGTLKNEAFLAVVDGQVALEWYGAQGASLAWPWESASKTMVGVLLGIAQDEDLLRIDDPVSKYLDPDNTTHWSSTPKRGALVTLEHLMTHTSGFDTVATTASAGPFNSAGTPCGNDDSEPQCLASFGTPAIAFRYNTGLYGLLRHVLGIATSHGKCTAKSTVVEVEGCFQEYFDAKLGGPLGMSGHWGTANHSTGYHYIGTGRDAARFGILLADGGRWNGQALVSDTYFKAMTSTNRFGAASDANNASYGYLTWLAGKESGLTPGSEPWSSPPRILTVPAPTFAPAPSDAIMAIGAGGQYIHVTHHGSAGTPPASLVIVRLGSLGNGGFANQNDAITGLWQRVNRIVCDAPPGSMSPCP